MDRKKITDTVENIGNHITKLLKLDKGKPENYLIILPPLLHSKIRIIYNIPFVLDLRVLGVRCIAGNIRTTKAIITKIKAEVRIDRN